MQIYIYFEYNANTIQIKFTIFVKIFILTIYGYLGAK